MLIRVLHIIVVHMARRILPRVIWASATFLMFVVVTIVANHERLEATPHSVIDHMQQSRDFMLDDTNGLKRHLSDYRGRSVVLYFFCGCNRCYRCARLWSEMQRLNMLTTKTVRDTVTKPITIIVFAGEANTVKSFAADTGLDLSQTVLLPDPGMHVTQTEYHVTSCPKVYVVNPLGQICYINNHDDDAPHKASETIVIMRVRDALNITEASVESKQSKLHQNHEKGVNK